ncbi:MAG: MarR family winged helix-turn-helix transcriptional regulator [Pseudolabrys sp.]
MTRKTAKHGGNAKTGVANGAAVEFGELGRWLGFNLRMAQEASFQAFSRRSREIGEHPGRFATLTLIAENPGISQTTLSNASGRDKSSMTPVLEDLVRRGLVQRKKTDRDRRVYRLSLTPAGARTLAKLTACAQLHENNLDRLIGRDRARFMRMLKRISGGLN